MSIHYFQSCLSKDFANNILNELSDTKNQEQINTKIIDPLLENVFVKLRGTVISFFVVIGILILLNTLIILQWGINNRKSLN